MRSFIFCTSALNGNADNHSIRRYRRWINHYSRILPEVGADRLFLIDDGGKEKDVSFEIIGGNLHDILQDQVYLYRFPASLGRKNPVEFPGWWRSFLFSIEIAEKYGYQRMIHIESDFFVLSQRLRSFIRDIDRGWTSMYSYFYEWPESGIQIICEDAFDSFREIKRQLFSKGYSWKAYAEMTLPFTNICKDFNGDRLGEPRVLSAWLDKVADKLASLDYIGQV
jgi:hypothetical protein